MEPRITAEQRAALGQAYGGPITVIDAVLQERYILIRADEYERAVSILIDYGVDPRDLTCRE